METEWVEDFFNCDIPGRNMPLKMDEYSTPKKSEETSMLKSGEIPLKGGEGEISDDTEELFKLVPVDSKPSIED